MLQIDQYSLLSFSMLIGITLGSILFIASKFFPNNTRVIIFGIILAAVIAASPILLRIFSGISKILNKAKVKVIKTKTVTVETSEKTADVSGQKPTQSKPVIKTGPSVPISKTTAKPAPQAPTIK